MLHSKNGASLCNTVAVRTNFIRINPPFNPPARSYKFLALYGRAGGLNEGRRLFRMSWPSRRTYPTHYRFLCCSIYFRLSSSAALLRHSIFIWHEQADWMEEDDNNRPSSLSRIVMAASHIRLQMYLTTAGDLQAPSSPFEFDVKKDSRFLLVVSPFHPLLAMLIDVFFKRFSTISFFAAKSVPKLPSAGSLNSKYSIVQYWHRSTDFAVSGLKKAGCWLFPAI